MHLLKHLLKPVFFKMLNSMVNFTTSSNLLKMFQFFILYFSVSLKNQKTGEIWQKNRMAPTQFCWDGSISRFVGWLAPSNICKIAPGKWLAAIQENNAIPVGDGYGCATLYTCLRSNDIFDKNQIDLINHLLYNSDLNFNECLEI